MKRQVQSLADDREPNNAGEEAKTLSRPGTAPSGKPLGQLANERVGCRIVRSGKEAQQVTHKKKNYGNINVELIDIGASYGYLQQLYEQDGTSA